MGFYDDITSKKWEDQREMKTDNSMEAEVV